MSVQGYSQKLPALLDLVVDQLAAFAVRQDRFDVMAEAASREYANVAFQQVYQWAMYKADVRNAECMTCTSAHSLCCQAALDSRVLSVVCMSLETESCLVWYAVTCGFCRVCLLVLGKVVCVCNACSVRASVGNVCLMHGMSAGASQLQKVACGSVPRNHQVTHAWAIVRIPATVV